MDAKLQTANLFDQRNHHQVVKETRIILGEWYERPVVAGVIRHLDQVRRLYRGRYRGYRKCNTDYHDLHHVYGVLLATVRLLDGCNLALPAPMPPREATQLCLAAIYHDSGFIQESWDHDGTGAKYTRIHIRRSHDFIRTQAVRLGIALDLVDGICTMISATDQALEWEELAFASEPEHLAACVVGTADIAGQMADRLYLEKLLFLYYELREAAFSSCGTAFDIIRNTAAYYRTAQARLKKDLDGIDQHYQLHFKVRRGVDAQLYQEAIAKQMQYLQVIIDDPRTNFRHKLRRLDLNKKELSYYV
jgi:hypothetical protein